MRRECVVNASWGEESVENLLHGEKRVFGKRAGNWVMRVLHQVTNCYDMIDAKSLSRQEVDLIYIHGRV